MDNKSFSCAWYLNDPLFAGLLPHGPGGKVFSVHQNLFASRSTYVNDLVKSRFHNESLVIRLDADNPTSALFVDWVYTDTLPEIATSRSGEGFTQFVSLFLLAQKLCTNPRLGDLVMNRIRQHYRQGVGHPLLQDVIADFYENLEPKSPLRRWLVRYVTWSIVHNKEDVTFYKPLIEEGRSFAMDLILVLVNAVSAPLLDPSRESDCKYHKHAEDVECDAQSFLGDDRSAESS